MKLVSNKYRVTALLCAALPVLSACSSGGQKPLTIGSVSQLDMPWETSAYADIREDDGHVAHFSCKQNFVPTKKTGLVAQRINPGDTHYIEFRVRVTPTIPSGHMHVVYGELNEEQKPKTFNYVGLLPKGSIFGLYAGIFVPVGISGELEPSLLDCAVKPKSAFRVSMSKEKYQKLMRRIAQHRANPPDWRMLSYNCNHFAADLGHVVGLRAPAGRRSTQFLSTVYFSRFLQANGEKSDG